MRLWHKDLIEVLPNAQLLSQWRECCCMAKAILEDGTPNHLLVNRMTDYSNSTLYSYAMKVVRELRNREYHINRNSMNNFKNNCESCANFYNEKLHIISDEEIYEGWHDKEYLRVCMANLYEKHFFGVGKSRITDEEWEKLINKYKEITNESYEV